MTLRPALIATGALSSVSLFRRKASPEIPDLSTWHMTLAQRVAGRGGCLTMAKWRETPMIERDEYKRLLEENQRLRASICLHGEEIHRLAENAGWRDGVDLSAQLLKELEPRK